MKDSNKFITVLFWVAAAAFAAVLIAGFIVPREQVVTRKIAIKAPTATVVSAITHFEQWPKWCNWTKIDSTMKLNFSGTDGSVGSSMSWIGDPKKTGSATISNVKTSANGMDFNFKLTVPQEQDYTGGLSVADSAGYAVTTFKFATIYSYPWNAFLLLRSHNEYEGKDLEKSLQYLKTYCEQEVKP